MEKGNNKPLENAFKERVSLIDEFFVKIESYSNQYDNLVLEFNPKVEDNRIVYSQPFGPGPENFHYIMKIKTAVANVPETIPLNTLSSTELQGTTSKIDEMSNEIMTELGKYKFIPGDTKGIVVDLKKYGGLYKAVKINKDIKSNKFELYILRNVNEENKIYSNLKTELLNPESPFGAMLQSYVVASKIKEKIYSSDKHSKKINWGKNNLIGEFKIRDLTNPRQETTIPNQMIFELNEYVSLESEYGKIVTNSIGILSENAFEKYSSLLNKKVSIEVVLSKDESGVVSHPLELNVYDLKIN